MARSGLSEIDKTLGTSYTSKFDDLHRQHIIALKDGNMIVAHEIYRQIQQLSNDVTGSWKKYQESHQPSADEKIPLPLVGYGAPPDIQLYYYTIDTIDGLKRLESQTETNP